jgi:hypothetical protein
MNILVRPAKLVVQHSVLKSEHWCGLPTVGLHEVRTTESYTHLHLNAWQLLLAKKL